MPTGAKVLHFDNQDEHPTLWAQVNVEMPTTKRQFRLAGTGHSLGAHNLVHVGTALFARGSLVFHLFEIVT
jgi:hypothetical protein